MEWRQLCNIKPHNLHRTVWVNKSKMRWEGYADGLSRSIIISYLQASSVPYINIWQLITHIK